MLQLSGSWFNFNGYWTFVDDDVSSEKALLWCCSLKQVTSIEVPTIQPLLKAVSAKVTKVAGTLMNEKNHTE